MDASKPEDWHFFISYAQVDRAWAEWIAWQLEDAGYQVLIPEWDFGPGSNWIAGMQAGTRDAARTIAVLSEAYLKSVYGGAEWQAAWSADPVGESRKLLPVRIEDCGRPGLLTGIVGFDLFGLDEAGARARLLSQVQAALLPRFKPDEPSPFPGAAQAMLVPHFPGAPRVWNVPLRNPHFTGRDTELAELARGLARAGAVAVLTVCGLGGVGKTALAARYAYVHSADYDMVWWVAAEEPALLPDKLADLAALLGAEPADEPEALQTQIRDLLAAAPRWLLIFDDANAAADIRPWLPTGPRPADRPGHVIVSTRRGGFGELGEMLQLDVLELADAAALIRTRAPGLDHATAERIAVELGGLPLALEQAGACLDTTRLPGEEYLERLRGGRADLYLGDISLERVADASPAAVQLLEVCACLASEPVPLDLFTAHPGLLPEPLSTAAWDPVAFDAAVTVLVDYSLATRSGAGLRMHRLVQDAVRSRLGRLLPSTAGRKKTRTDAKRPTSKPGWQPLLTALRLLRVHAPAQVQDNPETWPRWRVLLPHVLVATAFADPAQEPGRALLREARWLLDRAATYQQVHAPRGDALPLMRHALDMAEAAYGRDHPIVATSLNNLAVILRDSGRPEEARPLAERALAVADAAHGPDHPYVAACLSSLAVILRDLGRPGEARTLLERAMGIYEAVYGPDDTEVATSLSSLAAILRDLGQPGEARPLLERALAIDEAACGPDHPTVGIRLSNLAVILRDLGQLGEARPLLERALAIAETACGRDHPAVAVGLSNLAACLRDLGQDGHDSMPLITGEPGRPD